MEKITNDTKLKDWIPVINGIIDKVNTSGSPDLSDENITGILPIEHGGTGRNDGAATDVILSDGGECIRIWTNR